MTYEEMMALKQGDRCFKIYEDGDVISHYVGEFTLEQRDRQKLGSHWRSCRFVTLEEAIEHSEMVKITSRLTK